MSPPATRTMTVDSTLDPTSTNTMMNPAGAESDTNCRALLGKMADKRKEAQMRPKEANVAETSTKHTMTTTNQVGLKESGDGGIYATTGTRERRGRTTAADTHTSSSSVYPCNVNPPSGSGFCCRPCHPGCYNNPWHQCSHSPVFVSLDLHPPSVHIDNSRREAIYERFNNYGGHMTGYIPTMTLYQGRQSYRAYL